MAQQQTAGPGTRPPTLSISGEEIKSNLVRITEGELKADIDRIIRRVYNLTAWRFIPAGANPLRKWKLRLFYWPLMQT